jgi:hypothetical protein
MERLIVFWDMECTVCVEHNTIGAKHTAHSTSN